MTRKDTLNKTYGNIPKEVSFAFDIMDCLPTFRGIKYWYILVKRYFTR
jgi:hypothetical protein